MTEHLTQDKLDIIATYMNDEIREEVHSKFAPCSPIEFVEEYINRDQGFTDILERVFGIVL